MTSSKLAGIIGHPVAHSLSPVFQEAAFRAAGLDVRYERWDAPADELPARITVLREPGFLGANVTIPHKEAVLPFLDELDAGAGLIGAVNTIVNRGGRLQGFNTDGPGFLRALREGAGFDSRGASVLLLGAGGAARGIAFALAAAGATEIAILNRSRERAVRLARDVAETGTNMRVLAAADPLDRYDCAVNCTSVGMHGGPDPLGLPVDVSLLRQDCLVVDIVYLPEETPLLLAARARGMANFPGLPMLIHQGALAFEFWTGRPAPIDVMFEAARSELRARAATT